MRWVAMRAAMLAASCMTMPAAHGAEALTRDQATICEHILHFYPTPAPVGIAIDLMDGPHVLWTCQADAPDDTILMTFRDKDQMVFWLENAPEREILDGEGDDD